MAILSTLPHQLATAASQDLVPWAKDIIQPDHSLTNLSLLRQAIQTAVSLRLTLPPPSRGWFNLWSNSSNQSMTEWARTLCNIWSSDITASSASKLAALIGLWEGLCLEQQDARLRREVEVEVLVAIELGFQKLKTGMKALGKRKASDRLPPVVILAASVLPQIDLTSIAALETNDILTTIIDLFPSSLDVEDPLEYLDLVTLIRIVISTFELSLSEKSSVNTRQIVRLSERLQEYALSISPESLVDSTTAINQKYQEGLTSLILPIHESLLDLIASSSLPSLASFTLSKNMLMTFQTSASLIDKLGGVSTHVGLGNVWWGLIDMACGPLWSMEQRTSMIRSLREGVRKGEIGEVSRINYLLLVVEQFVGVDVFKDEILRELILPNVYPYLEDDTSKDVFESSHSVMLAIFSGRLRFPRSSDHDDLNAISSGSEELILKYCDCLIRNALAKRLSTEQVQHAFTILFNRASSESSRVVEVCLYKIVNSFPDIPTDRASLSEDDQMLPLVYLSLLPTIPFPLLTKFLAQAEDIIFSRTLPQTSRREEMVEVVWNGISDGLGDEGKEIGVAWWLEMRERLKREARRARPEFGAKL
ncbi:hypothetical protein [Phaffia rhodozyma]|uniref:Uncharacterized protein n=1 Tax=Phaffia rhodozyma TaxID=264483 RepID=A0A0F7SQF9_PHARH|nr:hypothetical protein [Phaffia rhodozyma]